MRTVSPARHAARVALALAALHAAHEASAQPPQSVTVGRAQDGSGDCWLFGCHTQGVEYQQLYAASAFSGPMTIDALTFFRTPPSAGGAYTRGTYAFRLATTTQTLAGLAGRPAANVTSPLAPFAVVTFDGSTAAPATTTVGGTAFAYDPAAGNLLLDVLFSGPYTGPNTNPPFFDADGSGVATRSVLFTIEYGFQIRNLGLVTRFDGTATPPGAVTTPEPASWLLAGVGLVSLAGVVRRRRPVDVTARRVR